MIQTELRDGLGMSNIGDDNTDGIGRDARVHSAYESGEFGIGMLPEIWDRSVDVLVVGSGFAGLAAATEAAEAGAETLVIEKMPYYGGNSIISGGGYCCWDSKLKLRENLNLGEDSWDLHKQDTLKGGGHYNSPELVEILAKEAPAGLDWMVDAGVEFRNTVARIGGHSAYRSYQAAVNGRKLMDPLRNLALAAGAALETNTKLEWVYRMDAHSPVAGVLVSKGGPGQNRTQTILARKAIIIASGGFGQDVPLRTSYKPTLTADCNCSNHKGATGEVIRIVKTIGVDTLHMEFIQLYPCANPQSGSVDQPAFLCFSGTGFGLLFVNQQGKRFINELSGREQISNAQLLSESIPTYSVLNAAIFAKLAIDTENVARMVANGRVVQGGTPEELAVAMGVPAEELAHTIVAHNSAITSGMDSEFGKPITESMILLTEGPYYAIEQWPSVHYCMGGIRINRSAQAIDVWGKPVPGLYAAGEVCGGVHGIDRLGGNGIAECIVFGRLAGRNSAV